VEWAGRIVTVEAIEALDVREAGAPVPHAEPGEGYGREKKNQRELRTRVAPRLHAATALGLFPE